MGRWLRASRRAPPYLNAAGRRYRDAGRSNGAAPMNIADLTTARAEADVLAAKMAELGRKARAAAAVLAIAPTEQKNAALRAMATTIRARAAEILEANR